MILLVLSLLEMVSTFVLTFVEGFLIRCFRIKVPERGTMRMSQNNLAIPVWPSTYSFIKNDIVPKIFGVLMREVVWCAGYQTKRCDDELT